MQEDHDLQFEAADASRCVDDERKENVFLCVRMKKSEEAGAMFYFVESSNLNYNNRSLNALNILGALVLLNSYMMKYKYMRLSCYTFAETIHESCLLSIIGAVSR